MRIKLNIENQKINFVPEIKQKFNIKEVNNNPSRKHFRLSRNFNALSLFLSFESIISNAIIIAETLCRNKQTQWKKIISHTIESKFQDNNNNGDKYPKNNKKIKVSIKLLRL